MWQEKKGRTTTFSRRTVEARVVEGGGVMFEEKKTRTTTKRRRTVIRWWMWVCGRKKGLYDDVQSSYGRSEGC